MKRNLLLVLFVAVFVSSCGSAPTVSSSRLAGGYTEKLTNMKFVYQESNLKESMAESNRHHPSYYKNGYHKFGDVLVDLAASEFKKYGVKVNSSSKVNYKDKVKVAGDNILMIYSNGGNIKQSNRGTTVNFIFKADYISASKRKIIWKGTVETNTWSGDDYLGIKLPQTLYDEKYAKLIFSTIAEQMKEDGLINK